MSSTFMANEEGIREKDIFDANIKINIENGS